MEYRQKPGETAGEITTGLRERFSVYETEDGERRFEVTDDLDAGAHQRLIDAGHAPLEPEELPAGVTYDPPTDESGESGSSSDSNEGPTDGSSEEDAGEEAASEEERTGSMTSDAFSGEDASEEEPEELPEPPEPLDEMNRSELYSFGNEELNLGLEWSGEEALNEEEMRSRIEEVLNDGE